MSDDTRDLAGCGCILLAVSLWVLFLYAGIHVIARFLG